MGVLFMGDAVGLSGSFLVLIKLFYMASGARFIKKCIVHTHTLIDVWHPRASQPDKPREFREFRLVGTEGYAADKA